MTIKAKKTKDTKCFIKGDLGAKPNENKEQWNTSDTAAQISDQIYKPGCSQGHSFSPPERF